MKVLIGLYFGMVVLFLYFWLLYLFDDDFDFFNKKD